MTIRKNPLGQPIGEPLPDWQTCPKPEAKPLSGRFCRLEKLDVGQHAKQLFQAFANLLDNAIKYTPVQGRDFHQRLSL